jgi:hypothetical protein
VAKIGMGKKASVEKEINKVISEGLPKEEAFARLSRSIMEDCIYHLKDAIVKFRENFVLSIGNKVQAVQADLCLLPEGTRFFTQTNSCIIFVIEQKPGVRTLFFEKGAINLENRETFRLSLPYIIFIPIFSRHQDKSPYLSGVITCYRNNPLTSLDDMLFHPNLPNMGQGDRIEILPEGNITDWTQMIMCQGHTEKFQIFWPKSGDVTTMVNEIIGHFWDSKFGDHLDSYYFEMAERDPGHFKDLSTWERSSIGNPFFVLQSQWVPAVRLSKLLSMIVDYHDNTTNPLISQINSYISQVHDQVWQKVISSTKEKQKEIANIVTRHLDIILRKFSQQLGQNLAVIPNDTIRRTVQLAIAKALTEATE